MPQNPYSQNNSGTDDAYTSGGYDKAKLRKVALIVLGVFLVTFLLTLFIHGSQPDDQQSKYQKSATAAARKKIPNAKVTSLKVSGGFALAVVSDPTANGQASAGNTTVFKVNKDGSMVVLANASSFSPFDLLELGIPLATQAKLTGLSLDEVKQKLGDQCGYEGGGVPGYSGFDGSFNPDGWEIDSATLDGLEQAVSDALKDQNAAAQPGKSVVCVNALQENSNLTDDAKTYISTYTLQVRFVTGDGTLSTHTLTFAIGPDYRNYTLDGQNIQ